MGYVHVPSVSLWKLVCRFLHCKLRCSKKLFGQIWVTNNYTYNDPGMTTANVNTPICDALLARPVRKIMTYKMYSFYNYTKYYLVERKGIRKGSESVGAG